MRAVAICLAAAVAVLVVFACSAANVFQLRYPTRALAVMPGHAGARATLAQQLFQSGSGEDAERFARASLARAPASAAAVRTLGMVAESRGADERALSLFRLAHQMSRRDRPTEAWLIRQGLESSDFGDAIRHFSILMRVARRGEEQMVPLLAAATVDRRVVGPLRRELVKDPQWKVSFLLQLASLGPNPDHVAALSRGLLDVTKPQEQVALRHLIAQLAERRRYDLAWSFYREARPAAPAQPPGALAPGGFARRDYPPFDWWLAEAPDLAALLERRPDGGNGDALSLLARGGASGDVAHRLLRLRPGRHVIDFETGAVPAEAVERPVISLTCADAGTSLLSLRLPETGSRTERVRNAFTVPAGCSWQWLRINLTGGESTTMDPWLANLSILPAA